MKTTKTGKLVHFAKNIITEINEDKLNSCLLATYYEDEDSYHITAVAPGLSFYEICVWYESHKFNMKTDFMLVNFFDFRNGKLFEYKIITKDLILDMLNLEIEERTNYLNEDSDETN